MPRGKLTVSRIEKLSEPGRYSDGGCLFLVVTKSGAKQWIARLTIHGRQTDLGLGGHSYTGLEEAREEAARLRKLARRGVDPRVERRKKILTFEAAAQKVHQSLVPTWRSSDHSQRWLSSLEAYVFPTLGVRPIQTIGSADVLSVLSPIWTEKHDTARRVKQRISTVFDWAKGAGHFAAENPTNGLERALPKVKVRTNHMAAMPWQDVPRFMTELRAREAVSARALAYLILTAARSKELREARWNEVSEGVWAIPGERMKSGYPHRVPLSIEALSTLESVKGLGNDLIFPSSSMAKNGSERALSDTVFRALMDRMGWRGLTTHGFRSTFRDWCSDHAEVGREVAEAALAHSFGSKVERAYARSDLFERRRSLMDSWGAFCFGETKGFAETRIGPM